MIDGDADRHAVRLDIPSVRVTINSMYLRCWDILPIDPLDTSISIPS